MIFFLHENRKNWKNWPKFFHRVIFAFWIQICNPNLCKSLYILNYSYYWEMIFFCIPGPDGQNRWNWKNCLKFYHRVIFAFLIQIRNPNLCTSHTFWNTANIEKWSFFAYPPEPKWIWKNWPKWVIFAFWIQICNPNLCKSHIFWITANIEKWSFFAYADMMTKIDEIGKIFPKFFHRVIFALWIQICNPNLCKSHIFWITANIEKWSFFCMKIGEIGKIGRNSFIG